jgi:hypothetical protein
MNDERHPADRPGTWGPDGPIARALTLSIHRQTCLRVAVTWFEVRCAIVPGPEFMRAVEPKEQR